MALLAYAVVGVLRHVSHAATEVRRANGPG
jgi:hypothetical protein